MRPPALEVAETLGVPATFRRLLAGDQGAHCRPLDPASLSLFPLRNRKRKPEHNRPIDQAGNSRRVVQDSYSMMSWLVLEKAPMSGWLKSAR